MTKAVLTFLTIALLALTGHFCAAGSATWDVHATNNNWSESYNWTPETVPNGPDDVATFGVSNITGIAVGSTPYSNEINEMVFQPGASAYTFTTYGLTYAAIDGVGITNNSGVTQNFVALNSFGTIFIGGTASAGSDTVFTAGGSTEIYGGVVQFNENATAGDSAIIASCGLVKFTGNSTAAQATLIANAATTGNYGGSFEFWDDATGGLSRVIVNGDGTVNFQNGNLNLYWHHTTSKVSIGSLEGNGEVILWDYGAPFHDLIVGSNNLSTTFGGVIHGAYGTGTLFKTGRGTLTLSGANTHYQTVINDGAILASNTVGSATGTGPVQVNQGKLGGTGIIAGATTIGSHTGRRATLTPGNSSTLGTLTIQGLLTLTRRADYDCAINSRRLASDQVVANGATIQGATITLADNGTATLSAGTTFTVINNTSATPIAGTFTNLSDNSTITLGNNTYQVNYSGGDGNDLTLTVVP
jgi:hypothetical protein